MWYVLCSFIRAIVVVLTSTFVEQNIRIEPAKVVIENTDNEVVLDDEVRCELETFDDWYMNQQHNEIVNENETNSLNETTLINSNRYSQDNDVLNELPDTEDAASSISGNNSEYTPPSSGCSDSGSSDGEQSEFISDKKNTNEPNLVNNTNSVEEPTKKKARKGHANYGEWVITKNQQRRQKGLAYNGLGKDNTGKWKYNVPRQKRHLKAPCNCALSKKKSKIKCTEFNENERKTIFKQFWDLNWKEKKVFVRMLVDTDKPKDTKNKKNETSRRKLSLFFHLKKESLRIRVCKKMFLHTLCINEWSVLNWIKKRNNEGDTETNRNQSINKRHEEGRQQIRDYLNVLPKVESHYCRQSTSRQYLEPIWRTKSNVFREYEKYCTERNIKSLKYKVFEDVFNEMNLSIFMPKKDQCDLCIGYQTSNVSQEEYVLHQQRKEEARQQKEHDKINGKFVYTMDLQSVLLCPVLQASAIYFKTKLTVHNFTIFSLTNKEGYCYLWDESEGSLNANEFTSIICNFICNAIPFQPGDEIILFSDGCCYQNRNTTLANGLLNLAIQYNVTIIQKILEKGHTQMECDSMHSAIERRLRHQDIYTPAGYVDACKHARMKPKPYNVKYLHHNFFKNYNQTCTFYKSIRPGNKTGDPVITDLRALSFNPNGTIKYKLNHTADWQDLPQRRNGNAQSCPNEAIPNLYERRLKIKKEKWDHLQILKGVLEQEYHHFYDSLPHD